MRRQRRSTPGASARDERGAVAVFMAAVLVVLLGITAMVIDLGLERVTAADLQALADMTAMDLAHEIHGQSQASLAGAGDFSNPGSAVRKSAARNPDVFGSELNVSVDWGSYVGGVWDTTTNPPSAVRVVASADTDYSVVGGAGEVSREAYAVASSSACYRLGTFVAAIRSGDSTVLAPLNHVLGVNLSLVSYQALANTNITLAQLAATSAIGSPTALLTGTVTYSDLLLAMTQVLSNSPGSNAAAITALNTIRAVAGPVGAIALGDVLHVAPTDTAALGMSLNILDIVGSARLATGQHFLEVPNLQAQVPGVGSHFTGGLSLISAAQLACGQPNSNQSVARNAQLSGTLGIEFVNLPSLNLGNPIGTLQTLKGDASLIVNLADGEGRLIAPPEVHCGTGTAADPHTYSVAVSTQPATYSLRTDLEIIGSVRFSVLQTLGLGNLVSGLLGFLLPSSTLNLNIKVRLDVASTGGGTTSVANLRIPPNDVTPVETGSTVALDVNSIVPTVTAVSIGSSTPALGAVTALTNPIITELLVGNNAFKNKTLAPLIDHLNTDYVGPVARMVGLRFGGADVYAVGAVCGEADLWG
ncbi:hypothetical protein [Nocardioides stalactiti]|uniref:hypothetical protein n=1 Tax=Nocardioides stalactiti TaxID=2755356 RepID=UPI001601B176|nr:hypothetical protein [Nocardioides stalactiti]